MLLPCQYAIAGIGSPVSPATKSKTESDIHRDRFEALLADETIKEYINESGLSVQEFKNELDSLNDEEIIALSATMEEGGTTATGAVSLLLFMMLGMALIAILILYMIDGILFDPYY